MAIRIRYPALTSSLIRNKSKEGGGDVPLFETIKSNAGTQPKNEFQQ